MGDQESTCTVIVLINLSGDHVVVDCVDFLLHAASDSLLPREDDSKYGC